MKLNIAIEVEVGSEKNTLYPWQEHFQEGTKTNKTKSIYFFM